jgi:esterase/lipase superfamily enzyme
LASVSGLRSRARLAALGPERAPRIEAYTRVAVHYATDRQLDPTHKNPFRFTGHRGELRFGQAIVTIPFMHRAGEVELKPWYDPFAANKIKYFTIETEKELIGSEWESAVQTATKKSGRNAVLLFVHGYKNSFDDALYRTAQIAYDVHFKGAIAMFSWPSVNSVAGYPTDYSNAEWSIPDFELVLKRVIAATHSDEIYIIAHSMGNQVVTRGLIDLAEHDPSVKGRVRELILAAPDIDADIFRRSIAPFLAGAARRTTLYASSRDLALVASRKLQGYVRAGDTSSGVIVIPPTETIDASRANADLLGHSYVANSRSILRDIDAVINQHLPPNRRGLRVHHSHGGDYWVYAGN